MPTHEEFLKALHEGPERCHMEVREREACSACGGDWRIELCDGVPCCSCCLIRVDVEATDGTDRKRDG